MRLYIYTYHTCICIFIYTYLLIHSCLHRVSIDHTSVFLHNPLRGNPRVIGISVPFVMVKSLFFRLFFSNSPTWQLKSSHRPVWSHSNHHEIAMKSPFFPVFPDMFGPPTGAPGATIPHWATPNVRASAPAFARRSSPCGVPCCDHGCGHAPGESVQDGPQWCEGWFINHYTKVGPPTIAKLVYNSNNYG